MSHAVARAISGARERIVVASPVITDGPILGALLDVLHDGRVPVRGVYDRTQMEEAISQWEQMPLKTWKIGAFRTLQQQGHFSSKVSTPYAPGSVHDYLHVKLVVVDDSVFTGSYNLSHNGEMNAENLNRLDCAALADLCASWIDQVAARYTTSS
jgi:phosphatidylserine/phosphatidylglycerophosphate/cardiolipin synthase-like enzyme